MSAFFIERIAGGTDGADDVLAAVGIERFPQAPDMDIHGALIDVNMASVAASDERMTNVRRKFKFWEELK